MRAGNVYATNPPTDVLDVASCARGPKSCGGQRPLWVVVVSRAVLVLTLLVGGICCKRRELLFGALLMTVCLFPSLYAEEGGNMSDARKAHLLESLSKSPVSEKVGSNELLWVQKALGDNGLNLKGVELEGKRYRWEITFRSADGRMLVQGWAGTQINDLGVPDEKSVMPLSSMMFDLVFDRVSGEVLMFSFGS